MTGRTHDLAAITGLIGALIVNPTPTITFSTAVACLLANQFGGVAPDIDQPTAPFWRNLPIGGYFGRIITKMLGGHRFITHSLLGVALSSWLFKLFLEFIHPIMPNINIGYVWWSFLIGILSHLVFDSFTKEGVPWLLPVPIKFGFPPIKALRITTGNKLETFIVVPSILVIDIIFFTSYYNQIVDFAQRHLVR